MNSELNYYNVLGVSENSTLEEIENAFKIYLNKNNSKNKSVDYKIYIIMEAYDVLSDDYKRNNYDYLIKTKNYNKNYIVKFAIFFNRLIDSALKNVFFSLVYCIAFINYRFPVFMDVIVKCVKILKFFYISITGIAVLMLLVEIYNRNYSFYFIFSYLLTLCILVCIYYFLNILEKNIKIKIDKLKNFYTKNF